MNDVLAGRVVVEAHFRQVDNDAFARRVRQDEAGRQQDLFAFFEVERVAPFVGVFHCVVADAVFAADLVEGFALARADLLYLADDADV